MHKEKKNIKFIALFLVISFLSLLPVIFIYLQLTNTSVFSIFFQDYILSGNSLFFPYFPRIEIIPSIPSSSNLGGFTLGHLIDLIIIINLLFLLDTTFYHYIKVVFISRKFQIYLYIDFCELNTNDDSQTSEESSIPITYQPTMLKPNVEQKGDLYNDPTENYIRQFPKIKGKAPTLFRFWKKTKIKNTNFYQKVEFQYNKFHGSTVSSYFLHGFLGSSFYYSTFHIPHLIINNYSDFNKDFKQMRVI
ncbi:MAG: hypothetical protein ACFFBP_14190 [Promethearchaeota archaeon]